jgi:hypothetical protein
MCNVPAAGLPCTLVKVEAAERILSIAGSKAQGEFA